MKIRFFSLATVLATMVVAASQATAQDYSLYAPTGFMAGAAPVGFLPGHPMAARGGSDGAAIMPVAAMSDMGFCDTCDGACDGGCVGGACDIGGGCGSCGTNFCCTCGWRHRVAVFGEYLYLRVRDNEVPYGVEFDGPLTSPPDVPLQQGPVGLIDQDYSSGYRAGFDITMDCYSAIRASYTYFDTSSSDELVRQDVNNVVRSLVRHPSSINVASDGPIATGRNDIRLDLVDVEYRSILHCGCDYEITWLAGVRYGRLEQHFDSLFGVNGIDAVETDIDFDGAGVRFGLEGERYLAHRQLMIYGKAAVSFLAGEFTADFHQASAVDPVVVSTGWKAGRIVSIWDLEVGAGWVSKGGHLRLTAGYVFSVWDNIVKTDEWIHSVQRNDYLGLGDRMTLDGFVGRAEIRF